MKAAYIQQFGGPEVLKYGDLPDPVAGAGQVVVDTVAASVNGADPKVAAGEYKQTSFPLILGRDFSGVVSAVGSGVQDLKIGDEVFGVLEAGRDGTYCEKIAVGASIVAKKPAGMSHVDAAALALIGLTALRSVEDTLKLKSGETILIQGGAGGVAGFAIQLAQHIGAHVITTTSMGNLGFVRDLGADEVIDYKTTDFTKVVKNCDAVFETVGDDVATRSFAVLKPGGRATFIASGPTAPKPDRSDVTALRPAVPRERKYMERIAELHGKGVVRAQHVTLFELAKAREALGVSAARHFKGKLVLKVR
jgi:NADPH:quinone reductase-like Zn-dependent oxidoreductase